MGHRQIPELIAAEVEKLFRAEYSTLFNRARLLTQGDRFAAEHLVQQIFEDVARGFTTFPRGDGDRRARMFTMLKNKAIDRWRQDSKMELSPDLTAIGPATSDINDLATLVVTAETIAQLWKAMQSMPPAQYRVAYLDWECDYSTREIADVLEIKPETVRVHRFNAIRQLREPDTQPRPSTIRRQSCATGKKRAEGG